MNLVIYWKPKNGKIMTSVECVEEGRAYVIKVRGKPIVVYSMNIELPIKTYKGGSVVPVPAGQVVEVVAPMDYPGKGHVSKVPVNSTSGRLMVRYNGRLALVPV